MKRLRLAANLSKGSGCPLTNSKFLILFSSTRALMTKQRSSSIFETCFMMPLSNFLYYTLFMLLIFIFLTFLSFRSR